MALRSPACNQNRILQSRMTCQYADKAQATSVSYGFLFCHEFEDVWSSLFEQVRKVFRATVPYAANSKNSSHFLWFASNLTIIHKSCRGGTSPLPSEYPRELGDLEHDRGLFQDGFVLNMRRSGLTKYYVHKSWSSHNFCICWLAI